MTTLVNANAWSWLTTYDIQVDVVDDDMKYVIDDEDLSSPEAIKDIIASNIVTFEHFTGRNNNNNDRIDLIISHYSDLYFHIAMELIANVVSIVWFKRVKLENLDEEIEKIGKG